MRELTDREWYEANRAEGDEIQAEGQAMERMPLRTPVPKWRDDGRIELLLKQSGVLVWMPDSGRAN